MEWRDRSGYAFIGFFFFLGGAAGCTLESEPLRFESRFVDFGLHRKNELEERILRRSVSIDVWKRSDVVIREVIGDCGCGLSVRELLDQPLRAGSAHAMPIELDLQGRVGEIVGQALLVTEPASTTPVILRVSAFVVADIAVHPSQLRLRAEYGSYLDERFIIRYHRLHTEPEIVFDEEFSRLTPFVVADVRPKRRGIPLRQINRADGVVLDEVELRLRTDQFLAIGVHDESLELAFKGLDQVVRLPATIIIEHPAGLSVDHVFLGRVGPGEHRSLQIPVSYQAEFTFAALKTSTVDVLSVDFDQASSMLTFEIRAPEQSGRFEGWIDIHVEGTQIALVPPIRLHVSGLIGESHGGSEENF
ncbi:MAG: hypothetical protein EA424_00075 [Planctomycetaceae bacterium]|nr:MAG: hypothetical protein EA424_00075 [Planctomycetaceae bacterium]